MTKKILIVEDEETIIDLVCAIFKDLVNYKTLSARDGAEALKIVRESSPDIILLDIQLPELNGHKVCKLIKSDPGMSSAKILMLSGTAQPSDWLKAKESGADGFVTKPFTSAELIEKVEELLRSN